MPDELTAQRVEAIPGQPLPHGLLSVATLLEPVDTHELNGVTWRPITCAEAHASTWCPPPDDPTKIFAGSDAVYAPPVAVYFGYECSPIGETRSEAEEYARAGLSIGEPRALEKWTWENALAPIAVDVTPAAGAVGTTPSLGTLEGALAAIYGGVGVIHAPVVLGAALSDLIVKEGARYRTKVGNYVSLGAGYPNTGPDGLAPADPSHVWMFASGPVVIRREGVMLLPDSDNESINVTLNDRELLAERTSVVGVECGVVAVLVDTSMDSGGGVDGSFLELEGAS